MSTVRTYTPPPPPTRGLPDARWVGVDAQPVSRLAWLPRESLTPNDLVIVDGEHRWTCSAWPALVAMTDGLVPVVTLNPSDAVDQRMATIRHNRARGSHYVVSMADIVAELVAAGVPQADVQRRLQMEPDEVTRLLERGNMVRRGAGDAFGEAWRHE